MSAPTADLDEQSGLLIIRRRSHADHAEVKGGVWKIAYADFMTAMMAFFLVMWLINATNEETRQAVASYFNPVKLSSINTKGLNDPVVKGESADGEAESDSAAGPTEAAAETATDPHAASEPGAAASPLYGEEPLFRDPYGVLAEIAGEGDGAIGAAGEAGSGDSGGFVHGAEPGDGDAYRDPFSPEFWQGGGIEPPVEPAEAAKEVASADAAAAAEWVVADSAPATLSAAETAVPPATAELPPPTATADAVESLLVEPPPAPTLPEASNGASGSADADSAAEPATELMKEIAAALGAEAGEMPRIAAESTDEGMLLSLTDDVSFGMFAIGSAEPQAETIRVMEKVAAVLSEHEGRIVIRGHTDSRPFKAGPYDNWRLSTDRAHMAYYMLVRGGLDQTRVDRIEGYADRRPKLPEDPEADENRRIEILIRDAGR